MNDPSPTSLPHESHGPLTDAPAVAVARPLVAEINYARPITTPQPSPPYLDPALMPRIDALFDMIWIVLVVIAAFVLTVAGLVSDVIVPPRGLEVMIQPLIAGLVALLAIWVILKRRRQGPGAVGLSSTRFWPSVGWALLTIVGCYAINLVSVFGVMALSGEKSVEKMAATKLAMVDVIAQTPPVWILPITILVGIYEELVVRGLLMSRLTVLLRRRWAAVLASAAIFGLFHLSSQGPLGVMQTFLIGVVFGVVAAVRRNLWACIIAHTLLDTFAFVMAVVFQPFLADLLKNPGQ